MNVLATASSCTSSEAHTAVERPAPAGSHRGCRRSQSPARHVSCMPAEATYVAWRPKIARYAYMARLPPANFCIWRFEPLGPLDSSSRPPPAHSAVSASRPFSGRIRGLPLGRDVGRRSGLRSACAAVRLAPRLTPVRRRAGGPPQAAPPPIAPRRDAARSPEPTARRPMRCRRSARVSRVLGRRAPGAAPEGRPRQPARASAALRLLSIAIMPLVTAAAAVDSAAPTSDAQISRGRRTLGAAAAAQVPTTGRRRRGGTCTYCARRRKQAAESPGRVLYAPGRPAVCKRGLLPAARGLSGEPEGVGRLRTSDAALCWALCHFRAAVAACGHGGRAAAAGGQHTRVCRRIRCPVLVLRTRTS